MHRDCTVVLAAVAVALAGGLAGVATRATDSGRLTADEPQYLLSAISLVEDGDLDVADELAAERWRPFHGADLPQQTRELADGRRVSPHDPLLPVLLSPGVAAAQALGLPVWLGARVVLLVVAAALAGLTAWTATRRFAAPSGATLATVSAAWLAVPLAPYATQLYPETPAALVVLAVVALLTVPQPRRAHVVAVVTLLVVLPWLAVKYAPAGATLGGVALVRWWRAGRRGAVLGALLAVIAAAATWVVVHQAVWGGLTAYASADLFAGRELSAVGFAPNLAGRARRLVGLLVGRDFGLAAWQPAWLLLVPALAAFAVRRPRGWETVVAPLVAGWLVATFVALTMQGWWVPGRQLVVVLPLAAVVVAWWVGSSVPRLVALGASAAFGVASWARLAWSSTTEGLRLVVDLEFSRAGDPVLGWWRAAALPAYLELDAAAHLRHAAWVVVLLTAAVAAARTARQPGQPGLRRSTRPVARR